MRLQPTLRRDAVKKMLAEDDSRIVWLTALGDGRFVPESIDDEAFRPLPDWVDYIIDRERQTLQTWMQAAQFDFESFICTGDLPIDPPKPPSLGKAKVAQRQRVGCIMRTTNPIDIGVERPQEAPRKELAKRRMRPLSSPPRRASTSSNATNWKGHFWRSTDHWKRPNASPSGRNLPR